MTDKMTWSLKEPPVIVKALLPAARDRLLTISDTAPLTEVAARLGKGETKLVVVCDQAGAMVGVVSKTDIVARIACCQGSACTTMVASVMTRDIVCCNPDDTLQDAWSLMKDKGFVHIPIVDEDRRPLGLLFVRDTLQALLGEVEYEKALLRDYVIGTGYR
jgi:CBS domain-containing protein